MIDPTALATEHWVSQDGFRLHYLRSKSAETVLTPIVFVPGGLGAAEDYLAEFESLAPRPCLSLSLRGLGNSDVAESGYGFEDFVGDISAVLADAALPKPCLMAYSMAAPLAIEYVAQHPGEVSGLIIGDFPPVYPKLPPVWVDNAMVMLGQLILRPVADAIQADSAEIPLWDRLPAIDCPVLVLRGERPGAKLSAEDADRYQELLPHGRVVSFPLSDHALWDPSYEQFLAVIQTFLVSLDSMRTATP